MRRYKCCNHSVCTKAVAFGVSMVLLLSGCQKNPESSIVVNKDMDNLIEQAQNTESGVVDVSQMAKNYESYTTEIADESLHVSVKANADVDIPEVEQLAVYRVRQMPISQELIDRVVQELLPGETLYDGGVLDVRTKKEIENEIAGFQSQIEELRTQADNGGEENRDREVYINEYQLQIDSLREAYENAPESVDWSQYVTDSKLRTTKEKLDSGLNYELYKWMNDLNPNGEVLDVTARLDNGNLATLYAQNNENYGNGLRYSKESLDIGTPFTVMGTVCDLNNAEHNNGQDGSSLVWSSDGKVPSKITEVYGELTDISTTPVTGTLEDAQSVADMFLNNVGINDFRYYVGGKYNIVCSGDAGVGYKTFYILTYMRNIEGVTPNYDATSKHMEGWQGDDYVKKDWPLEAIQFFINDEGIARFEYQAPLEITETVVDKSVIKDFDEVKNTFEQMVIVTNAAEEDGISIEISVDRVVLGYARISEANSYDTGLLVPVWDFFGKKTYWFEDGYSYDLGYGSRLTINAIDGSIIDRSVGY